MKAVVSCLFHKSTNTCNYIVRAENSKKCAIIDSVLDFNLSDGKYWTEHVDKVIQFVKENDLEPQWILETHIHADHLSGAQFLKNKFPAAKIAIGENIKMVQKHFKTFFNLGDEFQPDGKQFDNLFKDGESFEVGDLSGKVIHTPGHTPDSVSYHLGDCVFSGDTLFMPDGGSARCDFPNGSASQLFESISKKLYGLPDNTRMFVGHDYGPDGREIKWETTIDEQKNLQNI